jgi:hypothetical protein
MGVDDFAVLPLLKQQKLQNDASRLVMAEIELTREQ